MKPRDRRVKKATKPIRKAIKKLTEGMMIIPSEALQTGPRRIKPSGRITKEDIEKYMKKKPREFKTGIPRLTKGPMQAKPLPITPQDRKRINERKVPNPRAKSTRLDKGPKKATPLRRALARRR
jgi:hypothetical protein